MFYFNVFLSTIVNLFFTFMFYLSRFSFYYPVPLLRQRQPISTHAPPTHKYVETTKPAPPNETEGRGNGPNETQP